MAMITRFDEPKLQKNVITEVKGHGNWVSISDYEALLIEYRAYYNETRQYADSNVEFMKKKLLEKTQEFERLKKEFEEGCKMYEAKTNECKQLKAENEILNAMWLFPTDGTFDELLEEFYKNAKKHISIRCYGQSEKQTTKEYYDDLLEQKMQTISDLKEAFFEKEKECKKQKKIIKRLLKC